MKNSIARISLAMLASAPLAAAQVTIVGQTGGYATIQAAVTAASDGDTLIVSSGTYNAGFVIDGKALNVVGQNGIAPKITAACAVRNLAAGKAVVLSGLNIDATIANQALTAGLTVENNVGSVRVHECQLRGVKSFGFQGQVAPSLLIDNSMGVVASQCSLLGRDAGFFSGDPEVRGGSGVESHDSSFALYECTIKGGGGSHESWPDGGDGGDALVVDGASTVFTLVSGCTIQGGTGGGGDFIGCTISGAGGNALVLNNTELAVLDSTAVGGAPGNFGPCGLGPNGVALISVNSTVTPHAGAARSLSGPNGVTDKYTVPLVVQGEPGDKVWLIASKDTGFRYLPLLSGVLIVPRPFHMTVLPQGTIGASGTLELGIALGDLQLPAPTEVRTMQALCKSAAGASFLSSPLPMVVIDI